jgi:hypothetical protein
MKAFKIVGNLMAIWLTMLGVLAVAAVFVIMIALLIRFKILAAIGIMFIALIYLTVKMSGDDSSESEARSPKKYMRMKTPDGEEVLVLIEEENNEG